jgi:hypothetical protein
VAPSVCEQPPTTCVNRRKWFWQTVTNLCSVQEIKLLLQLQIPNMECLIINKTRGCRPFEGRMEKDITFVNYSYKKDTLPLTRTPVTNKVLASPVWGPFTMCCYKQVCLDQTNCNHGSFQSIFFTYQNLLCLQHSQDLGTCNGQPILNRLTKAKSTLFLCFLENGLPSPY